MKKKDKNQKRKKAPIIIAVIVILFIVIKLVSCALTPETGALVTTTTAVVGDLEESISTSGTVVGEEKKVFFAPAGGRIADVLVAAGDAVQAGEVLVSYDMEQMERELRKAALAQAKSNAGYQSAMADNSDNQAKLNEANTNLNVLNKQIEDNKAYLKDLQAKLNQSQRDTGNSLKDESYNLNKRLNELQGERSRLDSVSGGDAVSAETAKRLQEIDKEIQDINAQLARNSYVQSIADSSDYVADMEKEIANVQERITEYEEYKSRMESQKNTGEGTVLDTWDVEQYAADNELAGLTYAEAEEEYYAAKRGVCAEFDGIVTECSIVSGAAVTNGVQLLTLESSGNVKVTFKASKYDVEKLAEGQKVDVTISGNTYQGEISKINRMATVNESNTPLVGAEVHILDPDDRIILGLDAKLVIHTKKTEGALIIPVEAVNADKDGDFLYVVEDNIVVRKPIVCGISSDSYTEVVEGITEEDQIILTSYSTLEEGMAVTVMPQ